MTPRKLEENSSLIKIQASLDASDQALTEFDVQLLFNSGDLIGREKNNAIKRNLLFSYSPFVVMWLLILLLGRVIKSDINSNIAMELDEISKLNDLLLENNDTSQQLIAQSFLALDQGQSIYDKNCSLQEHENNTSIPPTLSDYVLISKESISKNNFYVCTGLDVTLLLRLGLAAFIRHVAEGVLVVNEKLPPDIYQCTVLFMQVAKNTCDKINIMAQQLRQLVKKASSYNDHLSSSRYILSLNQEKLNSAKVFIDFANKAFPIITSCFMLIIIVIKIVQKLRHNKALLPEDFLTELEFSKLQDLCLALNVDHANEPLLLAIQLLNKKSIILISKILKENSLSDELIAQMLSNVSQIISTTTVSKSSRDSFVEGLLSAWTQVAFHLHQQNNASMACRMLSALKDCPHILSSESFHSEERYTIFEYMIEDDIQKGGTKSAAFLSALPYCERQGVLLQCHDDIAQQVFDTYLCQAAGVKERGDAALLTVEKRNQLLQKIKFPLTSSSLAIFSRNTLGVDRTDDATCQPLLKQSV